MERPWSALIALGGILTVASVALIGWQVPLDQITLENFGRNGILSRSLSVVAAGLTMAVAGAVATVVEQMNH